MIKPKEESPLNSVSEFVYICDSCGHEEIITNTPPVQTDKINIEEYFSDIECQECGQRINKPMAH